MAFCSYRHIIWKSGLEAFEDYLNPIRIWYKIGLGLCTVCMWMPLFVGHISSAISSANWSISPAHGGQWSRLIYIVFGWKWICSSSASESDLAVPSCMSVMRTLSFFVSCKCGGHPAFVLQFPLFVHHDPPSSTTCNPSSSSPPPCSTLYSSPPLIHHFPLSSSPQPWYLSFSITTFSTLHTTMSTTFFTLTPSQFTTTQPHTPQPWSQPHIFPWHEGLL